MILRRVHFKKPIHFYATGTRHESLDGPAEVIGSWVKVRVPRGAGGFVECLVWGDDCWPCELEGSVVTKAKNGKDPITDVLGDK